MNDTFIYSEFKIQGDTENGWKVFRNDEKYLQLGPGYELLKTLSCGICSTDIARRFLPFELPQITGHEVIARRLDSPEMFAIEINDTPYARGVGEHDEFSREKLHTHTPGRMVLGINRLPGGFGPYILAPVNSIIPLNGLNESTGVLIEPFAAALQAVISSPPKSGDEVVVLGPRRLGMLLIAALSAYRTSTGVDFRIGAISRHDRLIHLAQAIGADFGVNNAKMTPPDFKQKYDIVYDTTGNTSGFEAAIALSRREIHVKSTNGQQTCGLKKLTAFVVDELSLLPFTTKNISFQWPGREFQNREVYIAPQNSGLKIPSEFALYDSSIQDAEAILQGDTFKNRVPRFDIAVVGSIEEIDSVIRPSKHHENALVRPQSAILFKGDANGSKLLEFINNGGEIRSSRCGDFKKAIEILKENPTTAFDLQHHLVSHVFPADELVTAFDYAKKKSSIKVVVKH